MGGRIEWSVRARLLLLVASLLLLLLLLDAHIDVDRVPVWGVGDDQIDEGEEAPELDAGVGGVGRHRPQDPPVAAALEEEGLAVGVEGEVDHVPAGVGLEVWVFGVAVHRVHNRPDPTPRPLEGGERGRRTVVERALPPPNRPSKKHECM